MLCCCTFCPSNWRTCKFHKVINENRPHSFLIIMRHAICNYRTEVYKISVCFGIDRLWCSKNNLLLKSKTLNLPLSMKFQQAMVISGSHPFCPRFFCEIRSELAKILTPPWIFLFWAFEPLAFLCCHILIVTLSRNSCLESSQCVLLWTSTQWSKLYCWLHQVPGIAVYHLFQFSFHLEDVCICCIVVITSSCPVICLHTLINKV